MWKLSNKITKTTRLLCKLQKFSPKLISITIIYKSFIRPHFDYRDILYVQVYKKSFYHRLKTFQYKLALAIAKTIRRISKERLFHDLGLKSLEISRTLLTMYSFQQLTKKYLLETISALGRTYVISDVNNMALFKVRIICSKNHFSIYCIRVD